MNLRARRGLALVVPLGIAIAACGGRVNDPPDGGSSAPPHGGSQDGSSQSASDGSLVFGVCPADRPAAGDPCVQVGQGCVYAIYGSCEAFVCDSSGHWQSVNIGC